jgi:hypothetical protein
MSVVGESAETASARRAGIVLVAATLVSIVAMAHHPSVASHDAGAAIAEIGTKATLNRIVHGVLIALMGIEAWAFAVFADRLGGRRDAVRLGFVAYAIGIGAMIGAALISGFVVTRLAAHYADAEADPSAFANLAQLAMAGNQALAALGVVAISVAILAWSVALLHDRARRGLAIVGLTASVLPALALLAGVIRLDVAGMTLVVVAEAVWNIAAGVALIRRRL